MVQALQLDNWRAFLARSFLGVQGGISFMFICPLDTNFFQILFSMATFTKRDAYNLAVNSGFYKGSYEQFISPDSSINGGVRIAPYTDDDYLSEIEQYKDKSWYNQLLTNPWLAGNQSPFSPNLGQSILSLFGDTSAEDKYYGELRSNRSQWLSEFLEKMRQQDYNSPTAQVQREKAAGLNPDLDPGSIDSGSAAENDQPILGHPSFGEPVSIQGLGSFFMNIYSLASGFAKDAISMKSAMNQLTSEDLDINSKIVGNVTDYLKGHVSVPKLITEENGSTRYDFPDLSLSDLDDYAKSMFRSSSARKRFKKEVNSSYNSARSNFATLGIMKDANDAKRALANSIGASNAIGGNGVSEFDPMVQVTTRLNKLVVDVQEFQNKYTSDYFHSSKGDLAGRASNSENQGVIDDNKALSYKRGIDKIINQTFESIVKDLQSDSRNSGLEGLIAKGMLGYLSAYRLQMIPNLPSISFGRFGKNGNFGVTNIGM